MSAGQEGHFHYNFLLMDCSYGQTLAAGSQARKRAHTKLTVTIWVEGTPVTALVYSGCSQMLI